MIFSYKSFFLIYILSFSLVGLWTIRVKSSVLRSHAKDMTITRQEMGLECGWCHARKRWSWEYEDFEKRVVKLILDHGGWEVEFRPLEQRVEFFGSLPAEMNWDLKHHEMCQKLRGGVNIVWLQKTFKNCVSLLVSKNRSQKLIKTLVPETTESACIMYLNMYLLVPLILILLWLWLRVVCNRSNDWHLLWLKYWLSALIAKVMIVIFICWRNDCHLLNNMKSLSWRILDIVFSRSYLYVSSERHQTKVPIQIIHH